MPRESEAVSDDTVGTSTSSVELHDSDIPGAHLEEPLEAQNVAALRWWLLLRH